MKITETELLRRKKISEYAKERYKNNSFIATCNKCGKEYKVVKSKYDRGRGKYCSKECQYIDKKGVRYSVDTEFKRGHGVGEKNINWKGKNASIIAIHKRIERYWGIPEQCENCGKMATSRRSVQWANRGHTYKEIRNEWLRLCCSCHKLFDLGKIVL